MRVVSCAALVCFLLAGSVVATNDGINLHLRTVRSFCAMRCTLTEHICHISRAHIKLSPHNQLTHHLFFRVFFPRLLQLLANDPAVPQMMGVAAPGPEYFIQVRDGQFVNGCNYFKLAGWNQWEVVEAAAGAPFLSGASIPKGMTGPQLVRTLLRRGAALGFNVMRTW